MTVSSAGLQVENLGDVAMDGSLSSHVVSRLEYEILMGHRRPGEHLDERQLAERFKISRTPVRESLQRLVASGLAVSRGRQGLRVAQLSMGEILDAFSVVAQLEALAARLAARRARPEHVERMQAAHQICISSMQANDEVNFYIGNLAFHEAVAAGSQNFILQDELRRLTLKIAPYRRTITAQAGRMHVSVEQHGEVLNAIIQRDSELACDAMNRHISILAEGSSEFLHFLRAAHDAFGRSGDTA
ncbi:GntR family transcriptional regulator [Aureimonas fodinaquatilis]|uniref:GntR family transcriptional regulator n=1 Tax=Aureimonas fodinaquatilis TaxID=2565783 RepID=A0A5B0DU54_9HYPH|nr:GntR family transcriptional regulator [Aureimonas fodinaquatilis]KAA0969532.1 GntR family transcriptional regulator [Aureimonas fodinaquatilis]